MEGITSRIRVLARTLGGVAIDILFVTLWLVLQWAFHHFVVVRFTAAEIQKWMLNAFETIFAVSTLAPVLAFVITDLIDILYTTKAYILTRRAALAGPASAKSAGLRNG